MKDDTEFCSVRLLSEFATWTVALFCLCLFVMRRTNFGGAAVALLAVARNFEPAGAQSPCCELLFRTIPSELLSRRSFQETKLEALYWMHVEQKQRNKAGKCRTVQT